MKSNNARQSGNDEHLYQEVAQDIARAIEGGSLQPGQKVPSVRHLSAQRGVSISTVLQAYRVLENDGLIEARPQSGYFVRTRPRSLPPEAQPPDDASDISTCALVRQVLRATSDTRLLNLSVAVPGRELLPWRAVERAMGAVLRHAPGSSASYDMPPGCAALRGEIARRAVEAGCALAPDELLLTSGATEAINLCLRAVTKPGDTVAIESPVYFGVLQIFETLGLRALELPTHPREGLSLEALEVALESHEIGACLLMPNLSNPLGSTMPDARKQLLVEMLAARQIPLIEDDTYGDLSFAPARGRTCKSFDTRGDVLLCSSFSKTMGPGLRVGWAAPGNHLKEVLKLKMTSSMATATLPPLAVAEFLQNGSYDHHLRRTRKIYAAQLTTTIEAVSKYFPDGTRLMRPDGGFLMWVEMPTPINTLTLFFEALEHDIAIAPGCLFSARDRYNHCLRLSAGMSWNSEVERALQTLGNLAKKQLQSTPGTRLSSTHLEKI
jgi:DNA-binding transcriptional MocR family regulator